MECKKKACAHIRATLENLQGTYVAQIQSYKADLEAARVYIQQLDKKVEKVERRCNQELAEQNEIVEHWKRRNSAIVQKLYKAHTKLRMAQIKIAQLRRAIRL